MMYHASSGITRIAKKSTSSRVYFRFFRLGALHTVLHTYDLPSFDAVPFTCTLLNRPPCSTAKSYCTESPHGFETVSPCADALAMNCNSTHSPCCFLDRNILPTLRPALFRKAKLPFSYEFDLLRIATPIGVLRENFVSFV